MVGFFKGLDSKPAIASRAADSPSTRKYLDADLHEASRDHRTLSRSRRVIDGEANQTVFTWMMQRTDDAKLLLRATVWIEATTLEANGAMRSIGRRETGAMDDAFLNQLPVVSGRLPPSGGDLARCNRTRTKMGSNEKWTHPHDPATMITKMKGLHAFCAHGRAGG